MRDIDDHAEAIHFLNDFAAELGQAVVHRRDGLNITEAVHVVMHQRDRPQTRRMRCRDAFQTILDEIAAFAAEHRDAFTVTVRRADVFG